MPRHLAADSGECRSFIVRSTDASIQSRLDGGPLDQEAFVDVIP